METRHRAVLQIILILLPFAVVLNSFSSEQLQHVTIRLIDKDTSEKINRRVYYNYFKVLENELDPLGYKYSTEDGIIQLDLERGQKYSFQISRYPWPYEGRCIISVPEEGNQSSTNDFPLTRCFILCGKVVTECGTPLADFELQFGEQKTENSVKTSARARTDKSGNFAVSFIMNRDGLRVNGRDQTHRIPDQRVDFDGPLIFVAESSHPVRCSIVNDQGETLLIEGSWLKVSGTSTGFSFHEGYTVVRDLPDGTHTVELVIGDVTVPLKDSTLVTPSDVTNRTFSMEAPDTLSVCVQDAESGTHLDDAVVSVRQYGRSVKKPVENGCASFEVYRGRAAATTVHCEGYFPVQTNLHASGESQTIRLKKGAVLSGVVRNAAGVPVEGAKAVLLYSDGMDKVSLTSSEGLFELAGLVEGKIKLIVKAENYAADVRLIDLHRKHVETVILEQGVKVWLNAASEIDVYEEQSITDGNLVLVSQAIRYPMAVVQCKDGKSAEVQVLSGNYDVYWVGKDMQCAFKLKSITVSDEGAVDVLISKPAKEDVISGPEKVLAELIVK